MSGFTGNDHLKAWEAEIRADERANILGELREISDSLGAALLRLDDRINQAFSQVRLIAHAKAPKSPAVAQKTRKAVRATGEEMQAVLEALTELQRQHISRYFSIKELCGAVGLGAKTVGAALRSLEEGGALVEKGRKYCLAAVEQTDNGAGLYADNPPF